MPQSLNRDDVIAALDGRELTLTLLPTEKCNFRCTYCYEDFAIGAMSRNTVEAVKQLITRRSATLQRLTLSWFGGEPLLAAGIVAEIGQHAQAAMSQRSGSHISAGMTTNGYLLDDAMLTRMNEAGVRSYQISLDGTEATHNQTRRRADGLGSFTRIWQNLLNIRRRALDVKVLLRVHVLSHTVESVGLLLDQLDATFGGDERFQVFLKPVEKLGGLNDASLCTIPQEQREQTLDGLQARLTHTHLRWNLEDEGAYICYAAKPNQLLIRANGELGKCTLALGAPSNRLGRLNDDGTIEVDQTLYRRWIRGFQDYDLKALSCPHQGIDAPKRTRPVELEALSV